MNIPENINKPTTLIVINRKLLMMLTNRSTMENKFTVKGKENPK